MYARLNLGQAHGLEHSRRLEVNFSSAALSIDSKTRLSLSELDIGNVSTEVFMCLHSHFTRCLSS